MTLHVTTLQRYFPSLLKYFFQYHALRSQQEGKLFNHTLLPSETNWKSHLRKHKHVPKWLAYLPGTVHSVKCWKIELVSPFCCCEWMRADKFAKSGIWSVCCWARFMLIFYIFIVKAVWMLHLCSSVLRSLFGEIFKSSSLILDAPVIVEHDSGLKPLSKNPFNKSGPCF